VSAAGLTFASATNASTTFTMPAKAVTVTATFKDATPDTYAVTVNGGTADKASAAAGDTVSITATVPSGKVFKEWTANPAVIFANKNSASTSFSMPASAVTVTAVFDDAPPSNTIFGTRHEATFLNWLLFFLGFGFIWMWF
jgi:hypothetical protein